ncbi:MAG: benzoylformate decarboxylase [Mycobacterium sp.]|nr:thiamine pyrophosphate TPP-binding protein [Mycobacterium sp.]MDT5134475.1 benzoylformate decarboxylase [Mycobacterium sp.]
MATGHRKLLEQLRADGITRIFGNPGSTEEGLLDEIDKFGELDYVMGLQEAALILLANGYALATQKPTVVLLHSSVGLGNALGSLYHVCRMQRSPLIVLAGEAGVAYDALDAHMSLDLVTLARPVTKYAARAIHPGSALRLLRRCIKIAATPPFGPTFLALPQDILDQQNDEPVIATVVPQTRVAPEPAAIDQVAGLLRGATRPVIIMGDGVAHANAQAELTQFAEVLGAGVWGAMSSQVNIPWTHPLYMGLTGHMYGQDSDKSVAGADAVIIVGTYAFPEVFPQLQSPFGPDATVIHIDQSAYDIAKNHPITLGVLADPKPTLRMLAEKLTEMMTDDERLRAHTRAERLKAHKDTTHQQRLVSDSASSDAIPLHMSAFAEELAHQIPDDAVIVDESLTNSEALTRYLPPEFPGSLYQTPGGTLGVGLPGAIGVKLAEPARTVVGFSGDGGALYTLQALWTAAHYRIGAKFVVCNNRSYQLLKDNLARYWQILGMQAATFPSSFDIHDPDVNYVSLAEGLGVPGLRVAQRDEIAAGIKQMLVHDGPFLIEVVLRPDSR